MPILSSLIIIQFGEFISHRWRLLVWRADGYIRVIHLYSRYILNCYCYLIICLKYLLKDSSIYVSRNILEEYR